MSLKGIEKQTLAIPGRAFGGANLQAFEERFGE